MKVNSLFLLCLFLTISSVSYSQDYKNEIENQFIEYNKLIINKEFEKSMNFVPVEVFELVPKAQMIRVMETTFNNSEMEFELESPKIINISDVENIEDRFYSLLQYSSLMKMKLKRDMAETEEEQKLTMNLTKATFQKAYGSENVEYDEKTGFYNVIVKKQAYAISNDGKGNWKFLVVEKKQKPFLDKLLPKRLIDKI
jgi:hypothetical protein